MTRPTLPFQVRRNRLSTALSDRTYSSTGCIRKPPFVSRLAEFGDEVTREWGNIPDHVILNVYSWLRGRAQTHTHLERIREGAEQKSDRVEGGREQ